MWGVVVLIRNPYRWLDAILSARRLPTREAVGELSRRMKVAKIT